MLLKSEWRYSMKPARFGVYNVVSYFEQMEFWCNNSNEIKANIIQQFYEFKAYGYEGKVIQIILNFSKSISRMQTFF